MNCKKCGYNFKMLEVPIEERVYGPFSAIFPCPKCKVILQADKKFRILNIIGITLFVIGLLAFTLNEMEMLDISYQISFSGIILGFNSFVVSLINTQTEIIEES